MQTSAKGIAALKDEEGEVLKAYLCPAHRWTIGVGLTAASGVINPKAGMTITREQSTALLAKSLRQNYEPVVAMAMTDVSGSKVVRPEQHEFDAGVSFHFNTGAIKRASWVKKWLADAARRDVRAALLLWVKGGGKVLPGLRARRDREAAMLLDGAYTAAPLSRGHAVLAQIVLRLSPAEITEVRAGFRKLGYDPGPMIDGVKASSVVQFQRDHGLTDDGIIGRATLSTLQRRLDAPGVAAKPVAAASLVGAGSTTLVSPVADTSLIDAVSPVSGAEWISLGLVGLWGLRAAWSYRDVLAAKIARPAPRLATFLRSF